MSFSGSSIQHALAQGVPAAISFSWFIYPSQALMVLISTGRLMPAVDFDSMVVNIKTGYARKNKSWLLGRVLRDWDYAATTTNGLHVTIVDAVAKGKDQGQGNVYEAYASLGGSNILTPVLEFADHLVGLLSHGPIILQGIIALISLPADSNPLTWFLLFLGGLSTFLLAYVPHWRAEKFNCRKNTTQNYALTEGNGSPHVLIIRGNGIGLNLEDLASNRAPLSQFGTLTLAILLLNCALSVLIFVLIASQGVTMSTLAILGLGECQNIIAGGAPRSAAAHGFCLRVAGRYQKNKVIEALAVAEEEVEGAGFALLPVFFPGKVNEGDVEVLEGAKARREKEA